MYLEHLLCFNSKRSLTYDMAACILVTTDTEFGDVTAPYPLITIFKLNERAFRICQFFTNKILFCVIMYNIRNYCRCFGDSITKYVTCTDKTASVYNKHNYCYYINTHYEYYSSNS